MMNLGLRLMAAAFASAGATPSYIGSTSAEPGTGTGTMTVTPHASTAVNDLLVFAMYMDGTGGTVDASGWTLSSYIGTPDLWVLYRLHNGSATYAITRSVSTPGGLYLLATFRNAAFDVEAVSAPVFTAAPILPSVTPTATALLFGSWGTITADNASVVPSTFTDIPDIGAGAMATEYGYSNSTYPASATGTFAASVNFSSSRTWRALNLAIKGATIPFVPTDITGLELWFDAADSASITSSGGLVSQWNDKSGNARHVTAASDQPTTGSATIGGINAIAFDASDVLKRTTTTLSTTTFTFFGVVDSAGTHRAFFTSALDGGIGFTTNGTSSGLGLLFPSVAFEDTATADNNALIFVCRRTGGTATVWKNGGTSLLTKTNTPSGGTNTICVGKDNLGGANENIGDLLWYNSSLSDVDVNVVGSYLASRRGLSWTNI